MLSRRSEADRPLSIGNLETGDEPVAPSYERTAVHGERRPKAAGPLSTKTANWPPAPSNERMAAHRDGRPKADGPLSTKNGLSASKFRALAPPLYCARVSRA